MKTEFINLSPVTSGFGIVTDADFDEVIVDDKYILSWSQLLEFAPKELYAQIKNRAIAEAAASLDSQRETLQSAKEYYARQ